MFNLDVIITNFNMVFHAVYVQFMLLKLVDAIKNIKYHK